MISANPAKIPKYTTSIVIYTIDIHVQAEQMMNIRIDDAVSTGAYTSVVGVHGTAETEVYVFLV